MVAVAAESGAEWAQAASSASLAHAWEAAARCRPGAEDGLDRAVD